MIHFVVRGTEEKIVPVCMGVGEMTTKVCVYVCIYVHVKGETAFVMRCQLRE